MWLTIQLPDGTFMQRHSDRLQPDDMIVFCGCETPPVEYRPQQMDWDFDAPPPPADVRSNGSSFDCPSVTFEPMPGALDWVDA